MTAITPKTTIEHGHQMRGLISKTGRFVLHLLEMLLAMQAGMVVFHLMLGLIRTYSNSTAWEAGTILHVITMTVFMIVPMAAWMIFRGHGWRHCAEMVIAMTAPIALIGLLCQLGVDAYIPWLVGASTPAMLLGMIVAMLYRRDHYTQAKSHEKVH